MFLKNIFVILIGIFLFITFLFSQTEDLKFEHISVEKGLSHTIVNCIFQDSKGFMWFGTEDGLNKFDGYKFTVYRHDVSDSTTLSYNDIRCIYIEDFSGQLWIATLGGGINKFDHQTERFSCYTHDPANKSSLPTDSLYCLTGFRYGEKEALWIGSIRGLCKYDLETGQFTCFPHTDRG